MDVISRTYNHLELVSNNNSNSNNIDELEEDIDLDPDFEDEDVQDELPDTSESIPNITDSESVTDDNIIKFPLRRSLFPNVPPYIVFHLHDSSGHELPPSLTKHLKWKLSCITPILVRKTVLKSGYRLLKDPDDWLSIWGKQMKSSCFKGLKDHQKFNHFPGTFQIGRKDRLWRNLSRFMIKYGKKEFNFVPRTYVLPQDLRSFRQIWEKSGGKEKWIIKPPASARGTGIRVVHRWSQIPKKRPLVVQQYLSKPLLIGGAKFDLRLYVLVSSINPLRIYIYPDGLVRFASVKYNDDINYLSDRLMHLTNYSINKNSSNYTSNDCADSCSGHKWTVKTLWSYLEKDGVNTKKIWSSIKDIVIKTVISTESPINTLIRTNTTNRYTCFELFGVDILLDESYKPWLLEFNVSPSLQSASALDIAVKGPMIKNVFNIVGFRLPANLPKREIRKLKKMYEYEEILCQNTTLDKLVLSNLEKQKQALYSNLDREDYLDDILEDLTPDDVRCLIAHEDEITQTDKFERIFPNKHSHPYLDLFDVPRYYNMLLDAWEDKYGDNREEGIALLQKLCGEKMHLETQTI
ncbi:tubulin monoglutamylase TTLL4 [Microplitis demolitor]|uniref:tubulin monoglutamylase TTLL4 n=1 Tax=Microplitis demolitor TaxID=69319 RepID=UPI0004CD05DB|nr:tubulin monoglutamylase TTLL4 [Microplitis demolitor]XP_053593792.1 tubulin monoglutamylase TTLL4 [Microplitis demolitor]XP_053593793.1 tubulin monoglutamylase TTLL4 [Microplitis demolitor]XP_053593794.1 tubulin monoglutamylase TTLL4 [Microplitis demolitor]XP_053593795.1 tubulin monoglutamylase TTLL4 [Microplitis demolitor]